MPDSLVSCVCVTYGRPILLGEAVKCFLDQSYPNKELIIVNDQEGVTLKLDEDRDNVRIENIPERFGSLGEKRNYAMSLAQGDYICIWDDDDLYTPWRIEDSVLAMQTHKHCDIAKGQIALMSTNDANYMVVSNLFHSQGIISKQYAEEHSYANLSVGEDSDYERKARVTSLPVAPFYWYVYRWGHNIHHLSGISDEKKSWERSLNFDTYNELNGEIIIKPEFQKDHWQSIINFFSSKQPSYALEWEKRLSKKS